MEENKAFQIMSDVGHKIDVGGGTDIYPLEKMGHYGSDEGKGESVILERPCVINAHKKELLSDLNFSRGFAVTPFHSNSWDGKYKGFLSYDGKKAVEIIEKIYKKTI